VNIGYACLTIGVRDTDQKSCLMKNAEEEKLSELISHNLNSLENIIDYNINNSIKLFRISSDIIPFGSSPVNELSWWNMFSAQFKKIGEKIRSNGIRVSMHPGQYTVLNSPDEGVVRRAVEDLKYHARVLESLEVSAEHKIILHIGGIYNDKKQAKERFIRNYHLLEENIKSRLVLENDDKSYNIHDLLEIGTILNIPIVYDNLHNLVNPYDKEKSDFYWIDECAKTWQKKDGVQKIHYSEQDPAKKAGSHSHSIRINNFLSFYNKLERKDLDIMLEVKDKNLSAVKCINCLREDKKIKFLEEEWSRYKYKVLENSPSDYVKIRKLLNNKKEYPAVPFYNLLEGALEKESKLGDSLNGALHVWGYFKNLASEQEKKTFFKRIDEFSKGKTSIKSVKNILWRMSVKYGEKYLLDSYYFVI